MDAGAIVALIFGFLTVQGGIVLLVWRVAWRQSQMWHEHQQMKRFFMRRASIEAKNKGMIAEDTWDAREEDDDGSA